MTLTDVQIDEMKKDMDMFLKELKNDSTRLGRAKMKAVTKLFSKPRVRLDWRVEGMSNLNVIVYRKKLQQIREAESAEDLKQILMHPKLTDYGDGLKPQNKWVVPEEELIMWSNTSMMAPLSKRGFDRYIERSFARCSHRKPQRFSKERKDSIMKKVSNDIETLEVCITLTGVYEGGFQKKLLRRASRSIKGGCIM